MTNEGKYRDEAFQKLLIERLQQLRNAHHLSQEELIESTHLDISRYETGCSTPTLPSILKLCKFYKISLADFFAPFDYPAQG